MAVQRERPYAQFNFLVDLGTGNTDGPHAGFQECSQIGMSVDVVEYRNGNEKENSVRKLTGLARYPDVTLKRGIIGSLDLYQWLNDIRNGNQNAMRTVVVQLMNEDHTSVVQEWKLMRARIVKHVSGPFNARASDVAIEEITLAYERLETGLDAESHQDRVHVLAGTAVVPLAKPLPLESETLVQRDRRLVPRKDVELELPHAAGARPVDGRFEQRAPDA